MPMRRLLAALVVLTSLAWLAPAHAQSASQALVVSSCGTLPTTPTTGRNYSVSQDTTGKLCTASAASISGSTSNATSGQATTSNNLPAVSYLYGFNGATWDQLQVDASKFLKVNCAAGCAGGTASNASDAVATSSTNGTTNAWLYGFNGATFDRLRVDTNKFLSVNLGDVGGSAIALGQAAMAASLPVVIASNQSAVVVGNGQASTTSGQSGPLVQGAVTTAAPTYTTAQTDPISLDTAGNLRVNCTTGCNGSNASVGATGSAVPASGTFIAGGAAAGAGNLTGGTVKAGSVTPLTTDTSLVVSEYDGGSVTFGSKADAATCATANTAMSCWRQMHTDLTSAIPTGTNSIGLTGTQVSSSGVTTTEVVGCDTHVFKHISSATDTLAVQGVAAKIIKVCGVQYHYSGSAAQAVFLENTASANANCASANTQISGLSTGNSTTPATDGFYNAFWGGLANTSGNGLCINSSGTGGVDVDVWYTQGS